MEAGGVGDGASLLLRVAHCDLPALQSHSLLRALSQGRPRTLAQSCTFFDTAERDLASAGLALRLRSAGRSFVQLLAESADLDGDPFRRRPGEASVAALQPAPERVADPALAQRLETARAGRPLLPLLEIRVRRTYRLLEEDGSQIDFALDVGEIEAGGRRDPVHGLALELRQGEPEYLHRLVLELQEDIPLRLEGQSLYARGLGLATGERPTPRKAGRLALERDAPMEELLAALVKSGLDQVLANEVPAREGNDSEGVHQLRVGVRRLRATLALFGRMLPERESRPLKQELRWLGGALGPARDLDVVLEELLEPLARRFPDDAGLKRLRDEARELREESYARVRAALDSPRHAGLGVLLHRWWALRAWRDQRLSPTSARLFAPAADEVARLLEKRHRRALGLGKDVALRPVADRHVLRIQLKKLRYAADAARSLFPRKRTERYLARLVALQEVLGHLNDEAVAEQALARIAERLGSEDSPASQRAAGFVAGWAARGAERKLRRLDRMWRSFARAKPFWMD